MEFAVGFVGFGAAGVGFVGLGAGGVGFVGFAPAGVVVLRVGRLGVGMLLGVVPDPSAPDGGLVGIPS